MQAAAQINRNRIGQEKALVTMRADEDFPEFGRQAGAPLGVYGCLDKFP